MFKIMLTPFWTLLFPFLPLFVCTLPSLFSLVASVCKHVTDFEAQNSCPDVLMTKSVGLMKEWSLSISESFISMSKVDQS